MRDIIKNIQLPIDGKPVDFRLTKLDAFSGAALMQMLARLPSAEPILPKEPEGDRKALGNDSLMMDVFTSLSSENLRSLMTACLNHSLSLKVFETSDTTELGSFVNGAKNQPDRVTLSVLETDAAHSAAGWAARMLPIFRANDQQISET